MRARLTNYIPFLIVSWILAVSLLHPDHISGVLHSKLSKSGVAAHFLIVIVAFLGTGFLATTQLAKDIKTLRSKTNK